MSSTSSGATAPGKMLVGGEYAVLDGAPAIVMAVQRRARASWVTEMGDSVACGLDHPKPRFPEAAAARLEAESRVGKVPGELAIDVSALRSDVQKLGVGSSAAAAAAAAAAVHHFHGLDLNDHREAILESAMQGHAAVSPEGSGVDVAASVLGGTLRYVRDPMSARPVSWPVGASVRVVWTGSAASTRDLIARVHFLRDTHVSLYEERMAELAARAGSLATAFETGELGDVVAEIGGYGEAMAALGEAAHAPIVEERLRRIAELARAHGGAAKPSGAGGGDVGLAVFADPDAVPAFEEACAEAGFEVLDVELGGPGVLASEA